jgi:hypothetical protein
MEEFDRSFTGIVLTFEPSRNFVKGGAHPSLLKLMLGAAILQFIVSFLQSVYLLKIEGKFAVTANVRFLTKVFKLPMEFFSQRMARDIALRQESNQEVAATLLHTLGPQFLNVGLAQMVSRKRIARAQVQARDKGKRSSATAGVLT